MASIFSKIIAGEIPSFKIAEDDRFYAFLDINPLVEGHTLIIPKQEIDKLFDLDDESYQGLFLFTKKIATAIEKSFDCNRVAMSVIGLEVPHAHIHLIPLNRMTDVDFTRPKLKLSSERMQSIVDKIVSNI